jgi:transketolase
MVEKKITDIEELSKIAREIRIKVVEMIGHSGFGHAGGSMSMTELVTVLYFNELNIHPEVPDWEDRDRFVLSKGHACPALYAILAKRGFFDEKLLLTLDTVDSILQCHPDMKICPGIDMSTGALGQGLSAAAGMALGAKLRGKKFRIYCMVGDGEMMEGQVWEAIMSASKFQLDNLVVIVDYNKLALSGKVSEVMPLEPLGAKWHSFNWKVLEINGHDLGQIREAFDEAKTVKGQPTVIIAHTVKGKGISFYENWVNCHAVTMSYEEVSRALQDLECNSERIKNIIEQMKEGN